MFKDHYQHNMKSQEELNGQIFYLPKNKQETGASAWPSLSDKNPGAVIPSRSQLSAPLEMER